MKLCWEQAYSYIGHFMKIAQFILLVTANLIGIQLTTGVEFNKYIIAGCALAGIIIILSLGAFIIEFDIMGREISFKNKYNPELMKIYNNTNKDDI